jgi:ADP-heptose:LPS heptosyltransferase
MKNLLGILITFIFSPFFYIRIFLNKLTPSKKPRILLIHTGKIGDLVCATPVFREIKNKFPGSYLAAAIREQNYGVIQNNPRIDKVIFLNSEKYQGFFGEMKLIREIVKEKFTQSINLSPRTFNIILPFWAGIPERITSSSKLTGRVAWFFSYFNNYRLEYKQRDSKPRHNLEILKFLGIKDFSDKKEMFTSAESEQKANKFLEINNLKKEELLIGISVTAGNKIKEWEAIKFSQLADWLIEKLGAKIIFVGAQDDIVRLGKVVDEMKHKSILTTGFKLEELAALFKKFKLFISVDTGPLYIAHAVGTPVVDIVGPVDPGVQPPQDEISEIVKKDIYCFPCCFIIPPARECKEGHLRCIKEITVEDVFLAANKLVKKRNIVHVE